MEGKVFSVNFIATVIRFIVDYHNFVVCVVLRENGVKIVFNSEVGIIVVSWRHDTHGNLGLDLVQTIFGIQTLPFLHISIHTFSLLLMGQSNVILCKVSLLEGYLGVNETYALPLKLLPFLL